MMPLNPLRLVQRMMAPVIGPSQEVTERVRLLGEPDEGAAGPTEVDPT